MVSDHYERKGQIWVLFRPVGAIGPQFWSEDLGISKTVKCWNLNARFSAVRNAVSAAKAVREAHPSWQGVISVAKAWEDRIWTENDTSPQPRVCKCGDPNCINPVYNDNSSTAGEKESQVSDIKKPLHIPRKTLIARLEEVLKEKEKVRTDAEAEQASRRAKFTAAVKEFTDDELTNIFYDHVSNDIDTLEKWKEIKRFVSEESKPTPVEDQLAKQVRVLKMASDDDIEIAPNDNLYPLL